MRSKGFHVGQKLGGVVDDALIVAILCHFVRSTGLGDQVVQMRPGHLGQPEWPFQPEPTGRRR